jgi:thioesterase domain-containing protein
LPPGGGLSWGYGGLIKHIDKEVPIYGLQSRGLNEKDKIETSIEDIVRDYIEQIKSVQPSGPYNLLGWSFGGYIAYEIAALLRRSGEAIASLTLLDTFPLPEGFGCNLESPEELLAQELGGGHVSSPQGTDSRTSLKRLLRAQHPAFAEIDDDQLNRIIAVTDNNVGALRHLSLSSYEGDVNLMIASQGGAAPSADLWAPYLIGKVHTHDIPCSHGEMTRPHAIASIGAAMSGYISAAPRR